MDIRIAKGHLSLLAAASMWGLMSPIGKAAMDAGIVSQNINLCCAGIGLSTVPRASMDQAALKKILKLTDSQVLMMNNPVGYPK